MNLFVKICGDPFLGFLVCLYKIFLCVRRGFHPFFPLVLNFFVKKRRTPLVAAPVFLTNKFMRKIRIYSSLGNSWTIRGLIVPKLDFIYMHIVYKKIFVRKKRPNVHTYYCGFP